MLGEQLVADQANGLEIQANGFQIEERHAEFMGSRYGDIAGIGRTACHELGDNAHLALARDVHRLEHRGFLHDPVLHEALR